MGINSLSIPYPDFKLQEIINPDEFDLNNSTTVNKINDVIALINKITDGWVVTNADGTTTDKPGAELLDINAIAPFTSTKVQAFLQEAITRLQSTTDASSGADFIGSTTITGVTGATVQAQLESLKAIFDSLKNSYDTHRTSSTLDHPDGSVTRAKLDVGLNNIHPHIPSDNIILSSTGSYSTTLANYEKRLMKITVPNSGRFRVKLEVILDISANLYTRIRYNGDLIGTLTTSLSGGMWTPISLDLANGVPSNAEIIIGFYTSSSGSYPFSIRYPKLCGSEGSTPYNIALGVF